MFLQRRKPLQHWRRFKRRQRTRLKSRSSKAKAFSRQQDLVDGTALRSAYFQLRKLKRLSRTFVRAVPTSGDQGSHETLCHGSGGLTKQPEMKVRQLLGLEVHSKDQTLDGRNRHSVLNLAKISLSQVIVDTMKFGSFDFLKRDILPVLLCLRTANRRRTSKDWIQFCLAVASLRELAQPHLVSYKSNKYSFKRHSRMSWNCLARTYSSVVPNAAGFLRPLQVYMNMTSYPGQYG